MLFRELLFTVKGGRLNNYDLNYVKIKELLPQNYRKVLFMQSSLGYGYKGNYSGSAQCILLDFDKKEIEFYSKATYLNVTTLPNFVRLIKPLRRSFKFRKDLDYKLRG